MYKLISSENRSDSEDLGMEEKENFRRFLSVRNQGFIREMGEYINLNKIVLFLEEENHFMEYKEFK